MTAPLTRSDIDQLLTVYAADPVWLAERFHVHPSTVRRWIKAHGLTVIDAGSATPRVLIADVLVALGLDPETGAPVTEQPTQLMLRLVEPIPDQRKAAGS